MKTPDSPPVFFFPLYGSEASEPVSREQAAKEQAQLQDDIRKQWKSPGVKALVKLIERRAAIALIRSAQPEVPGGRDHAAGQAHGLQQLVAELQQIRLVAGA